MVSVTHVLLVLGIMMILAGEVSLIVQVRRKRAASKAAGVPLNDAIWAAWIKEHKPGRQG